MQQAGDPLRSNEDIWCKILAPATSPPAGQAGAKTKMRSFDPIHNLGHSHRHHWQNEIGISQSVVLLAFHRSHLVISRGHVMTRTPPHPPTSHHTISHHSSAQIPCCHMLSLSSSSSSSRFRHWRQLRRNKEIFNIQECC